MSHDRYEPALIRGILTDTKRIAMVGASPNASRPQQWRPAIPGRKRL